jgi:hypothetical protein
MQTLWAWAVAHPQYTIPGGLFLLNLIWRSPTRFGAALRTLGPDPVEFYLAMKTPPTKAEKKEEPK